MVSQLVSKLVALVVDPDEHARAKIRRALRRRGYAVINARSRTEASDHLDGNEAHLMVVDEPGAPGAYRVVWLQDLGREDVTIEPTRDGWRRFDKAR